MSSLANPAPPLLRQMPPLILACLAAVWLIWGSTYLAIKWALVSFPPFWQMGTRFIVAGLLLAAWMRWRGAAWPDRQGWINACLLGALMLGLGYGLTAVAEVSVSSGLVVAFIAIGPALQAALEWPYGVRPTRKERAGIGLGLLGVVGLAAGQGFAASPGGLAAVMVASFAWKLGGVWSVHGLPQALGGRRLDLAPGAMGYGQRRAPDLALEHLARRRARQRLDRRLHDVARQLEARQVLGQEVAQRVGGQRRLRPCTVAPTSSPRRSSGTA
jgi:hypothetical protein